MATVAVYSDCDRTALHVRLADEAHRHRARVLRRESYLRIDTIIDVARRAGADAGASGLRVSRRERRFRAGLCAMPD